MVTYTFRNKNTDEVFNLDMPMASRESFLENCPELEQLIVACNIADPMMLGHLPANAKDFQRNVLGRMAESIPGNNIKQQMKHFNMTTEI